MLLSGLFASFLLITACTQQKETQTNNGTEPKDASQEVLDQLTTQPIKEFQNTPNDAHDIQLLDQYDQNFSENSDALEADLKKRADEGNLTQEADLQLKRDSIASAMNMLKELDLKTEQGRYIQGLQYQYWENQAKVYDEKKQAPNGELKNPADAVKGMGDLLTAQQQLDHWKQKIQK